MQTIPLANLAVIFLPVLLVLGILYRWQLKAGTALYSVGRMLLQLLLIGYVLTYIFAADNAGFVLAVLSVMLLASSWIALNVLPRGERTLAMMGKAFGAILVSGGICLALVCLWVLELDPWYQPSSVIPLAGMIFSNSMTAISLAAERFFSERDRGHSYLEARNTAMQAAMVPMINSMFAVGLVALPGMMTGQILSGVSPLIAVRYQIMVMCMLFATSGMAAALYLRLLKPAR